MLDGAPEHEVPVHETPGHAQPEHAAVAEHSTAGADDTDAQLSMEEVAALLIEHKPIPGIRQIPEVSLGISQSSESSMRARKKPWEDSS